MWDLPFVFNIHIVPVQASKGRAATLLTAPIVTGAPWTGATRLGSKANSSGINLSTLSAVLALAACAPLRRRKLGPKLYSAAFRVGPRDMSLRSGSIVQDSAFALRSICGTRTEPYEHSELQTEGTCPSGASVSAVSAAGFKGRASSVNQDCVAVRSHTDGRWVACVLDGHGTEGHLVAARVSTTLPRLIGEALLQSSGDVPAALKAAFAEAERNLEEAAEREGFDVETSGCAAAAVALSPDTGKAYLISCGDCQAAVFDSTPGGAFEVTCPHKAHDPAENQRIRAAGGFIDVRSSVQGLFSRVYPPSRQFGLAMSRSFGDLCVKRHGVLAEPSVVELPLSEDICCVVGSDGLFEFITPAEVVNELRTRWPAHGGTICAEALVSEARERWLREDGRYCDDVTCLLLRVGQGASRAD
eukprot:CAMPEP_0183488736 /NCGR_PEP_ID=MMETSP0370-20130417/181090_1 /TAXON_ID=268820 /ORGANISM="Peridinium aciculiferum, Strain PAER-2" /LENGTH=415 /DNA_ID=CAMNT_0025682065 /DNA_START=44 /DNA_END=1288 /DNA_ORIENTATION=-